MVSKTVVMVGGILVILVAVAATLKGLDKVPVEQDAAFDWPACPQAELAGNLAEGQLSMPAADLVDVLYSDVELSVPLTVTHTGNLGRYGQLTLSAPGRLFHPNNGGCGASLENGHHFLVLEDGVNRQNPSPVPWFPQEGSLRTGSLVTQLEGWLTEDTVYMRTSGYEDWFVLLPDELELLPAGRPLQAPDPGGSLTVAGLNVGNYFTTLGDRGARTLLEFDRQHAKLVAALAGLNAHLIGLAEVENDDGVTLSRLTHGRGGLAEQSGHSWDWLQGEGLDRGNDAISLAFLYRSDMLAPVGPTLVDSHAIHNRPPLAQRFRELASGQEFTVVMTHLKSRGGCAAYDPDAGSGCWNERRDQQVRQLLDFLERDVVPSAASGILILGDLNSYALEEPLARLQSAGYTDLIARFVPPLERYTYVFEPGLAGYLDHALASEPLIQSVCGVAIWHINADEPPFLAWSGARFGPDMYSPDPFRSSDHDPVLVGLELDGTC